MIVVDLGCATFGEDESINKLIERFHPDVLYGFDPWLWLADGQARNEGDTAVFIERKAAWIYDGFIGYAQNGLRSRVGEAMGPMAVPCFDLAKFIWGLAPAGEDSDLVVKFDVETAEIPLLEHLHAMDADALLDLALVEWHEEMGDIDYAERKAAILEQLRCPVEIWT